MKIPIIGTVDVGLGTRVYFVDSGHCVICVDTSKKLQKEKSKPLLSPALY